MTADLYPLQVLLVTLAGWVNRHQHHVIEYLVLGRHLKTGQSWTGQNRPVGRAPQAVRVFYRIAT